MREIFSPRGGETTMTSRRSKQLGTGALILALLAALAACQPETTPLPPTASAEMSVETVAATEATPVEDSAGAVLIIVGNLFDEIEYIAYTRELGEAGYRVLFGSETLGTIQSEHTHRENWPIAVEVDVALADVVVTDYDAIILMGDFDLTAFPWDHPEAAAEIDRIMQEAVEANIIVGATWEGVTSLAHSGVIEGMEVTAPLLTCADVLPHYGVTCTSVAPVLRNGRILTARDHPYCWLFVEMLIEMLQEG